MSVVLVIIGLFVSSNVDCLYIGHHTLKKLAVPVLIGASVGGGVAYGWGLRSSLKKFKDLTDKDKKDDDDDKGLFGDRIFSIKLDDIPDIDFLPKLKIKKDHDDDH